MRIPVNQGPLASSCLSPMDSVPAAEMMLAKVFLSPSDVLRAFGVGRYWVANLGASADPNPYSREGVPLATGRLSPRKRMPAANINLYSREGVPLAVHPMPPNLRLPAANINPYSREGVPLAIPSLSTNKFVPAANIAIGHSWPVTLAVGAGSYPHNTRHAANGARFRSPEMRVFKREAGNRLSLLKRTGLSCNVTQDSAASSMRVASGPLATRRPGAIPCLPSLILMPQV